MDAAARDCSEQHKRGNAVLASYAYIKISNGKQDGSPSLAFSVTGSGILALFRRDCGPQR
jgi:hypothetical protein